MGRVVAETENEMFGKASKIAFAMVDLPVPEGAAKTISLPCCGVSDFGSVVA
jgi:hypothetical protein